MHIQVTGAVGQRTQRLDLGFHLRQFELHPLLVGQRGSEQLALLSPLNRPRNAVGQTLQATGRGPQPLLLELHHLVHEALTLLPDAVTLRNTHFVEIDQPGVAGMHTDLADLACLFDAGAVHRHHHQRLVLVLRPVTGIDQHAHPVGLQAVGDPHLLTADDVVVAILARMALDRRHVAAGTRLADADTPDHVARNRRGQKLAPELVTAKTRQGRRAHVGLNANGHRNGAAMDVAQGLGHRNRIGKVQARATKGLWFGQAQQAQVAKLLEQRMGRKYLGLLPFVHVWIDFVVNETGQRLLDFQMFVGELHKKMVSGWL